MGNAKGRGWFGKFGGGLAGSLFGVGGWIGWVDRWVDYLTTRLIWLGCLVWHPVLDTKRVCLRVQSSSERPHASQCLVYELASIFGIPSSYLTRYNVRDVARSDSQTLFVADVGRPRLQGQEASCFVNAVGFIMS